MKSKGKWLLLSAVLAFVTSYLLLHMLKSNATAQVVGTPKVPVVVAVTAIDEHSQLQPDMLKLQEVSRDSVPADALHSLQEAEAGVTRQPIVAGEMLQRAMLTTKEQPGSPFALKVPAGMRAVSIANNEVIGLNGMLVPGDHVDVIAGYKRDAINGKQDTVKIILQNIEVLAVGNNTQLADTFSNNGNKSSTGTASSQNKQPVSTTVTLAVAPSQAESLVFADMNGTIRLALRGVQDKANVTTSGVVNDTALQSR